MKLKQIISLVVFYTVSACKAESKSDQPPPPPSNIELRFKETFEATINNFKIRFYKGADVENKCAGVVIGGSDPGAKWGGGYATFDAAGVTCKDLKETSFFYSEDGRFDVATIDGSVDFKGAVKDGKVVIGDKTYYCLRVESAGFLKDGTLASNANGAMVILADKYVEKAEDLQTIKATHLLAAEGACKSFYK